jgi:hypothetical protein
MAFKKYLVDLDLSKNQLLNAVVQNLATPPASPNDGQIYWDTADRTVYVWDNTNSVWIDLGATGAGATNLSEGTSTNTTVDVNSSTGTNAILQPASTSRAGVLSKAKFDEIVANSLKVSDVNHNVSTNLTTNITSTQVGILSSDGTNATIGAASASFSGVMTAADKTKLDGIATGADVSTAETVTSIGIAANIITYTDEDGNDTTIDLSTYLDDTNLARLTSGSLNGSTGLATFTRSDASTFTIDMSALLDAITLNNTLTSTSTTEGLTANQGKVLKDLVDTKGTVNKVQVDCAAATTTTVTHTLGQYVNVDVYKKLTPFNKVQAQVTSTSATTVVVTFNTAPTAGEYVIVVQG